MSHGKQFTLYGHSGAPNPIKVSFVLEELGLTHEYVTIDIHKGENRSDSYTAVCPNGRVPALIDHQNGDFVIWESDAILYYLVERYDKEHKLSVTDANEKAHLLQWLFFQASGQGPYFGQAVWFMKYHPDRLPSAVERYHKEIQRVLGVLENVLSKQEWLVGGKATIADISFIRYATLHLPWNQIAIDIILKDSPDVDIPKQFPNVYKWHTKLCSRPAIAKVLQEQV
ncbi:glutathione S-transferase C-terminal-like protein [Daedaleopsis nitida]|nr:glutathione S-transferase C-terminal-like protein [Daedaleopsis nitida]